MKKFSWHLEILGEIARGGQARIFLGRLFNRRLVAIKFFESHEIYKREASYLAKLEHAFITRLLGLANSSRGPAIVLEYISGPNMANWLNNLYQNQGSISTRLLTYWAQQILEILSYLETKNIVHGDLAPENILIAPNGLIKLCDFGNAKSPCDFSKRAFGRVDFLAPEVLSGEYATRWSDLYSLGALLFEVFMQRRFSLARRQSDMAELRLALSENYAGLYYLINSCLDPSPWHRPVSATLARRRLVSLSIFDIKAARQELCLLISESSCVFRFSDKPHKEYMRFIANPPG